MHRITRRSVLVLVVLGALVAGGAAYTNTLTGAGTTNNTAGYKDVTVQGASLTDAKYTLTADGSQITAVTFTFANVLTNDKLQYVVDTGPAVGGGLGTALEDCVGTNVTAGVIQAAAVTSGVTTVTCTLGTPAATETATDLNVVVTNN
jgi:hypothetical protein